MTLVAALSCVRQAPSWYQQQDPGIEIPPLDSNTQIVDGATLQALRLAADDFIPPSSDARACAATQASHLYRYMRRGDIIFVEIERDPAACGGQGHALDGAGRYAISKDGRILRRVLDGDGTNTWPDDAGSWTVLPTTPDGWPVVDDTASVDVQYLPPWQLVDGGLPDSGAVSATLHSDAGTAPVLDAAVPSGPDAGRGAVPDAGAMFAPDGGTTLIGPGAVTSLPVSSPPSTSKTGPVDQQGQRKRKRRPGLSRDAGSP